MPGPLPRTKSNDWWNRRWAYRLVLLRELSAFAVAGYLVLLLLLVASVREGEGAFADHLDVLKNPLLWICLLYTSPSPRDGLLSRMPSSA